MVQNVSTLPATFPEYFDGGDVGILQNQTMFAYDSSLDGLWDARASFCGMLNNILISNAITYDRPEAVAAMVTVIAETIVDMITETVDTMMARAETTLPATTTIRTTIMTDRSITMAADRSNVLIQILQSRTFGIVKSI